MSNLERARQHCLLHNRDLASFIDESLGYFLDTVTEAETEILLEQTETRGAN
jgi:hypothetical protein